MPTLTNNKTETIPTGVLVTKEDWLLIQAYHALRDAGLVAGMSMQMFPDGRGNRIHEPADMVHFLTLRHGLPRLPDGGKYEIDYDSSEFIVDKQTWEAWNEQTK